MLERFRQLAKNYFNAQEYRSALYWAELAITASEEDIVDVYAAAKCMFSTRQFVRAAHLIMERQLERVDSWCKLLAARSLYEAKLFPETISLIEKETTCTASEENRPDLGVTGNVDSLLCLLKGKAYEAMDNRILAVESFKLALKHDVYCHEALEHLTRHHMLTSEEEEELLGSLPFAKHSVHYDREAEISRALYEDEVRKYSKPDEIATATVLEPFKTNLNLQVNLADRYFHIARFDDSYKLTSRILKTDPYHPGAVLLHITALVELKYSSELFSLAHRLVELDPDDPASWYCVACYYYVIGSNEMCRKYLDKANSLDRDFGPAHLLRGHAFGADSERDQAMACYFKVSQIMRGYHLPLLYLGMEHALTNSLKLAEGFFDKALDIMPNDPMVMHELGMVNFRNKEYRKAEKHFLQALDLVKDLPFRMDLTWEPLLNNLGHVSRKLKKYQRALEYHQQALMLRPDHAQTFSSIGFVHAFLGNYGEALEYFHKALGCKPDDAFSTTMLNKLLELHVRDAAPFDGALDFELPASFSSAVSAASPSPAMAGTSVKINSSSAMEISSSLADASDFL